MVSLDSFASIWARLEISALGNLKSFKAVLSKLAPRDSSLPRLCLTAPCAHSARPERAERHHSGDEQSPGLRPASRAGHPRTRSRTLYLPGLEDVLPAETILTSELDWD